MIPDGDSKNITYHHHLIAFLLYGIENIDITHIAIFVYFSIHNSLFYGTTRLINVQAVIKLAIHQSLPHFREIMRQLLLRYAYQTKFPHARCINNAASGGKVKHFGKRGCMQSLSTPSAYILCL